MLIKVGFFLFNTFVYSAHCMLDEAEKACMETFYARWMREWARFSPRSAS
jgi:hypothetical protein